MTKNYENAYRRALWVITEGEPGANETLGFKWRDILFAPLMALPSPESRIADHKGHRLGLNQIKFLANMSDKWQKISDMDDDIGYKLSSRATASLVRYELAERRRVTRAENKNHGGHESYEWRLVK